MLDLKFECSNHNPSVSNQLNGGRLTCILFVHHQLCSSGKLFPETQTKMLRDATTSKNWLLPLQIKPKISNEAKRLHIKYRLLYDLIVLRNFK